MAQERLEELTVAELRARAAELEIEGRSSMAKAELVEAVGRAQPGSSTGSGGWLEADEGESGAEGDNGRSKPKESGDGIKPASEITAPSIGPNTVIEQVPPEERLDKDKISDVDAMGLDKRRSVVGHSYSASFAKQATLYGIFLVVLAALLFGGKLLVDELDAPPAEYEAKAPWAEGPQIEPRPIQ